MHSQRCAAEYLLSRGTDINWELAYAQGTPGTPPAVPTRAPGSRT